MPADATFQRPPSPREVAVGTASLDGRALLRGDDTELGQQLGEHLVFGRAGGGQQRYGPPRCLQLGEQLAGPMVVDRQAHADPGQVVAVLRGMGAQLDGAEDDLVVGEQADAAVDGAPGVGAPVAGMGDEGADAQRGDLVEQ